MVQQMLAGKGRDPGRAVILSTPRELPMCAFMSFAVFLASPTGVIAVVRTTNGGLRLYNFPASQAGGANADPLGRTLHPRANRPEIHVPAALAHIVRVADVIPKLRPLAADLTNLCHECSSRFGCL
jgi:hypothetical protein